MKFLTCSKDGIETFGAVTDAGVVDLGKRHPELPDLRQAIRENRLGELAAEAADAGADLSLDEITYLPTIPNPEKIVCIGVNYMNRNAEYRDGSEAPKYPSVFMRTRESLTGHEQPLIDPPESDQLDYEGEIVIVVGKECRRVSEADAHEVIAGLTIMNEGSIRDWIRHGKFNVTPGKNFEKSGSSIRRNSLRKATSSRWKCRASASCAMESKQNRSDGRYGGKRIGAPARLRALPADGATEGA